MGECCGDSSSSPSLKWPCRNPLRVNLPANGCATLCNSSRLFFLSLRIFVSSPSSPNFEFLSEFFSSPLRICASAGRGAALPAAGGVPGPGRRDLQAPGPERGAEAERGRAEVSLWEISFRAMRFLIFVMLLLSFYLFLFLFSFSLFVSLHFDSLQFEREGSRKLAPVSGSHLAMSSSEMHRHMQRVGARGGQAEWLGCRSISFRAWQLPAGLHGGLSDLWLRLCVSASLRLCVSASLRLCASYQPFASLRTNQRTGWARLRDARWAEPGETSAMFLLRPSPGDPADLEWKPLGSCQIVRL